MYQSGKIASGFCPLVNASNFEPKGQRERQLLLLTSPNQSEIQQRPSKSDCLDEGVGVAEASSRFVLQSPL